MNLQKITPFMLKNQPDQTSYLLNQVIDKVNTGNIAKASSGGSATLYPTTGQNTDGAMTQKATTDALNAKANSFDVNVALQNKVDKVAGKGLSENDYTNSDKSDVAEIDGIVSKIPAQASSSNQLADKAFVNSSVQTATANFRGNWESWAAVPTNASLYPVDYAGSHTPTVNDYLVVQDASDYTEETLVGTWRFKYSGTWATDGKNGWNPEYQVNGTPLTAAQLAALNSGITSAAVTKLSGIQAGAEVNVQTDWNQTNTTADDYLKNKPTLGSLASKNEVQSGDIADEAVTYNKIADDISRRFVHATGYKRVDIPNNSDLNSVDFCSINHYCCSTDAATQTLTNCPTEKGFWMDVYARDNNLSITASSKNVHLIRRITDLEGEEWIQRVQINGSSVFIYKSWKKIVNTGSSNIISTAMVADNAVTSEKIADGAVTYDKIADAQVGIGKLTDDVGRRFVKTTGLTSVSIPVNSDLNSPEFCSINRYNCPLSSTVATLVNCPATNAFWMQTYNRTNLTNIDSTTANVYVVREITTITGQQYVQYVRSDASAVFTYSPWEKIINTGTTKAVKGSMMVDGTVGSAQIADGAVTSDKLSPNLITPISGNNFNGYEMTVGTTVFKWGTISKEAFVSTSVYTWTDSKGNIWYRSALYSLSNLPGTKMSVKSLTATADANISFNRSFMAHQQDNDFQLVSCNVPGWDVNGDAYAMLKRVNIIVIGVKS